MKKTTKHSLCSGNVPAAGLRCGARLSLRAAALLACTLLAASCAKEPVDEGTGGGRVEIAPRIGLPVSVAVPAAATRAAADPLQQMDMWFLRSDESAADTWSPYGTTALKATRTGGSGEQPLTFDPVQYYLTDGLKTRMVGWYPGGAAEAGGPEGFYDASTGTVSWTIDGGQDILLAAPRQGNKTAKMPVFEFEHALAQLQFCFYADSEEALEQWGKILGVAVRGQRAAAAFTPADATDDNLKVTFTGDATETFAAANFAEMTAPAGTKDDAAAGGDPVMIEPQETPCRLTVEVTTEKQGVQTAVVSEQAYTAGEAVKICFRLTEHLVMIDPEGCKITPWSGVTQTGDNEIGNENKLGYPYVMDGRTIVMSDAFGAADPAQYPLHEPWTVTPRHHESAWTSNTSGNNTYAAKFMFAKVNAYDGDWWPAAGVYHADKNPESYSACTEYSEEADQSDKGLWRLPTVRELKLVFDMMNQMSAAYRPATTVYWTATETSEDGENAWRGRFDAGANNPYNFSKANGARVRCVRDVVRFPYVVDGNTIVVSNELGAADHRLYPTHEAWTTTPAHGESVWNANESGYNTVATKFKVASSNAEGAYPGENWNDTPSWYEAAGAANPDYNPDGSFSACAEYSEEADQSDKGLWRLPTSRELKLIFDKKSELTSVGDLVLDNDYWSATEVGGTGDSYGAWYLYYYDATMEYDTKDCSGYVRCVRDL